MKQNYAFHQTLLVLLQGLVRAVRSPSMLSVGGRDGSSCTFLLVVKMIDLIETK